MDCFVLVNCVTDAMVKMILISIVSYEQQKTLLEQQNLLALNYFHSMYEEEATVIPYLGDDYSSSYGYTQEHHTLGFWLLMC